MKKEVINLGNIQLKTYVTCPNCWETASLFTNGWLYCNHCDYSQSDFKE